jgi:hypothetical protein
LRRDGTEAPFSVLIVYIGVCEGHSPDKRKIRMKIRITTKKRSKMRSGRKIPLGDSRRSCS